jgi:hypothetical protein
MHNPEPSLVSRNTNPSRRSDRVDSPQQYDNWREYAFSDAPEHESESRR